MSNMRVLQSYTLEEHDHGLKQNKIRSGRTTTMCVVCNSDIIHVRHAASSQKNYARYACSQFPLRPIPLSPRTAGVEQEHLRLRRVEERQNKTASKNMNARSDRRTNKPKKRSQRHCIDIEGTQRQGPTFLVNAIHACCSSYPSCSISRPTMSPVFPMNSGLLVKI